MFVMNEQTTYTTNAAGKRIRDAIELGDRTQTSVAQRLGVARSTLSQKLAGRTPFTTHEVAELSDLLGISCDYIIKGKGRKA